MATNAYAPYSPQVLGDSWVPIKEDPYPMSLSQEQGYWFNLSASSTVVTARVYAGANQTIQSSSSTPLVNIYAEDALDNFGVIEEVTIPCNVLTTFGSDTTMIVSGAITAPDAVRTSNGNGSVFFDGISGIGPEFIAGFSVGAFQTQLTGKRILNVELVYEMKWTDLGDINATGDYVVGWDVISYPGGVNKVDGLGYLSTSFNYSTVDGSSTAQHPAADTIGVTTPFYGTTLTNATGDRYPWNYASLSRLDQSITAAAQQLYLSFQLASFSGTQPGDEIIVFYAALKVTYCTENRVGMGARMPNITSTATQPFWGPEGSIFSVGILNTALSAAPTLSAGNYFVTVAEANQNAPQPMAVKGLRQLYAQHEPGIQGVLLPYNQFSGLTITPEPTDQIPTITLHTSSAVVADSHGYTDQLIAPVYADVVARQGVLNLAASSTQYNLARFFARRIGNTSSPLGLRLQSTPTTFAEISVADFDALDEITEGWRQVDLEFTSGPTFTTGGTATSMEFYSSTPSGSRWEVLGARSTIVTGFANNVDLGPNQWGAPTTYGGVTAVATWDQGSGTPTIDFRGDLTLMLASMPQVTGLTIEENLLEVAVTDECDQAPGAIPTGVYYHTLGWSGGSANVVGDTFDRTAVASGWGTSTSGATWTVTQGSAGVWSTNGSLGQITPALSTSHINMTNVTMLNAEFEATVSISAVVSTRSSFYFISRYADTSNYYSARVIFEPTGNVAIGIEKTIAGVNTALAGPTNVGFMYTAGTQVHVKHVIQDSVLMIKAWLEGDPEPEAWDGVAIDTSLTAQGLVGGRVFAGDNTITISVDDFTTQWGFGGFELQRQDQWTDWQTIMLATSPLIASFNDFEARVGVESEYRIRACHVLDFCGAWSGTVANTITAPGVTGTNVDSSLLIFTTNARQDGSDTLAYSEIFDGTPAQTFAFLEAAGITMQPMYLRDYQVAYHGTERGGQSFSRTVLFNNAAVSLSNFEEAFQSLRDLAWDSVPYICVRDEHGSRWLSNVAVGGGTIQPPGNSLWFTEVAITEVTATAYPVDPS